MTAAANRFPEWIRRKLTGDSDAEPVGAAEGASATFTGGRGDMEPVVVWEAAHVLEAEIVKGRLEAEGIPAIIRSEALGKIYGLTSGGLAKADVMVPGPLADRAIEVLSSEPESSDEE
jgi:hypothetical protein